METLNSSFETMEFSDIEIEIDEQQLLLMDEIVKNKSNLDELTNGKLNKDMFSVIKDTCLNSLKIAFEMSDCLDNRPEVGASATTPHNFNKEIFATKGDKTRYENLQARKSNYDRGVADTSAANAQYRQITEQYGFLQDGYTGKSMTRYQQLEPGSLKSPSAPFTYKASKPKQQYDADHIISAKEYYVDPTIALYYSADQDKFREELRTIINDDKNFTATTYSINRSKKDKDLIEWSQSKSNGRDITNAEFFGCDPKRIKKEYEKAHNHRKCSIVREATGKDTRSLLKSSGKLLGKSLLIEVVTITIGEFIEEFCTKIVDKAEKLLDRLKRILKNIWAKIKNLLKKITANAVHAVASELMNYVINFFVTTVKKIFKLIRQMFGSIVSAFKVIVDKKRPWKERVFEALKIISAGFAGVLGYMLGELIEKFILTALPALAPLTSILTNIFSGMLAAIASALVLNVFDSYKQDLKIRLQKQELLNAQVKYANNSMLLTQITNYKTTVTVFQTMNLFSDFQRCVIHTNDEIEKYNSQVHREIALSNELETKINQKTQSLIEQYASQNILTTND